MKNYILILSLFLYMHHANAQTYEIEKIALKQGLSNNYIMGITQDRKGFMWFSTESGLNRFDGNEFRIYRKNSSEKFYTINGNELNTVYADKFDNTIWIATQRDGLNAFDCNTETFRYYKSNRDNPDGIITNDITNIINSKNGNLWITTYHWGFDYFDKVTEKFTHYNRKTLPDLVSNNIWSVAEDKKGLLYLGHVSSGLSIFNPKDKMIQNYKNNPLDPYSIPGNGVNVVFIDSNDNVWVGTDNGLALFNPDTKRFTVFRHSPDNDQSLISNFVLSITQLNDGKLWIGTENGGISILNIQQNMFLTPQNAIFQNIHPGDDNYSLSNQTIRKIYQDSFNNIWIGTYGGGINFISNRKSFFQTWNYSPIPNIKNTLSNKIAWGLCLDDKNRLWIGTDGGGIDVFENGTKIKSYNKNNSELSDNAILSAYKDSQNNLWFGTFSGGVNIYSPKDNRIKPFPIENVHDVRCFTEDNEGNIWIGSSTGIYVCNSRKEIIHSYTRRNSELRDDLVRSIFFDKKGNIWIGFFGEGVGIYSPEMKMLDFFNVKKGLPSNMVNHIYGDKNGKVWVGTGEGLICFDSGKESFEYTIFNEKNGMNDSHVRAITEDNEGNIWLSTTSGISAYQAQLDKFYNFNHYDGIPLGDFMSGSVAKTPNGIIYFGSQNGVCFFDPKSPPEKIDLPHVVITDFKVYNTRVESSSKGLNIPIEPTIKLDYNQNTFDISFNILDYSLNHLVEYSYMLKGLENTWYNSQGKNSITFRNIPHGSYQLLIKSRARNQEWSDEITSLDIEITPPLWLTWWAKAIYMLLIITAIISIVRFYKHKLELESSLILEKRNHQQEHELNNERLRFYTNITHELRTPLTLILGPLEDLNLDKTLSEKHSARISAIYKSATRLLNLINQILEFRRTETQNKKLSVKKDNLVKLIQEIGLKYKELNSKKNVSFHIIIEEGDYIIYYDADIIATILENLISNALKYTEKGSITLTLRNVDEQAIKYTEIEVKDTGKGIHPDSLPKIFNRYYQEGNSFQKSGTGIGLALVQNLVKLHQGEIFVESTPDEGTTFRFRIKPDNQYPHAIQSDSQHVTDTDEIENIERQKAESKQIILVIEDNEEINKYIAESLSEDYKVHSALNGKDGLKKAYTLIPDIIISDIMMPELDGLSLTRKIKDDIRTSHIPTILLTAKDTIQDKTEGYSVGADSYITKPFSSSLLKSRIQNLLESRRKLAQQLQDSPENKADLMIKSLNQLDQEFIEKVSSIIDENIDSENLDVNLIADKMFMSHSTLYRKIKALTEMSINEFIRKKRIKKAEQLLLTGKYTVSEISFMVGMNSIAYFRQCFKEEFGLTPSDYVKHIKESGGLSDLK